MSSHQQTSHVPRRALFITAIALGLGIIFDLLFYEKLPGISFVIYVTLTLSALLGAAHRFRVRLSPSGLFLTPAILFFAWMVFVRAGGFVTFLNISMTLFLLGLFVGTVFRPHIRRYVLWDYLAVLYALPLETLIQLQRTIKELTSARRLLRHHEASAQILRGVIITVPVLVVFVLLFSSADLVFKKYTTDLFSLQISPGLLSQTCLVAFITAIFIGVFAYLTAKQPALEPQDQPPAAKPSHIGIVETTILFGSLNLLFLGFIIVQLAYLFGGEQNIMHQGFTYAEYARKGFFELIAVSVLSLVVVLVAERLLMRKGEKHSAHFKFLSGALVAQVLIIMLSALNRLSLYENAYGFTTLRLYSHICIVWLAAIFGILLYKIFVDQRENTFAYLTFLSVLTLLVSLNIVNPDAFVARQNINRYEAKGKIDADYLGELSDDGVTETVRLLDAKDRKVRDAIASQLFLRQQDLQKKDRHWQSANLSRSAALKALEANKSLLKGQSE